MFEVLGVEVHILAITIAMVANFVLGAAWYSPVLFGNIWMKLLGKKDEDLKMTPIDGMISVFISFLTVVGLNSVLQFSLQVSELSEIINIFATAFMITFTLNLPIALNGVIYEGRSFKVFLINISYFLVANIVIGTIISIWV